MATFDVPGVGTVIVTIDEQEFYQGGYVLRSLETAVRPDGSQVTGEDLERVTAHLRGVGAIQ
ncbi:hypothetical protein [Microbacterium sp. LWH3-1.2]|uniref:hypothetical protein n=1 Tax=Microbacterium sp. LWH3-1.2 TaxID=3135256 RepID=UPI0034443269